MVGPHNGAVPPDPSPAPAPRSGGSSQRQHILSVALSLMAQHGVDGTSMRDLAGATGLNVASLYHYFPSKRDLLVAVLEEHGFVDGLVATAPPALAPDRATGLADLVGDILTSMLEVEDFVRLMLGEVMRGDETAHAVGVELFRATQVSLERWLEENRPGLGGARRADGHGPDVAGDGRRDVHRARGRGARRRRYRPGHRLPPAGSRIGAPLRPGRASPSP